MKLIIYLAVLINSQTLDPSKLYKEGNYSEALKVYLSMIKENPYNPYLYYNVGNCYYKLQDKPLALAYYIKTFMINPRLSKNLSNLKKIAQETVNEIYLEDIPEVFYKFYYLLSEDEIKALIHIFLLTFVLLIGLYILKIKFMKKTVFTLSIALFVLFLWLFMRENSIFHNPIVTIKETDILSGPNKTFSVIATVPQAKILILLSKGEEFSEVGVPTQNIKGWIKNEDIIIIKEM